MGYGAARLPGRQAPGCGPRASRTLLQPIASNPIGFRPALPPQSVTTLVGAVQRSNTAIWRCPRCRGVLVEAGRLTCAACEAHYETIAGIPDLRLPGASWVDYETDLAAARRLAAETAGSSMPEFIRYVLSSLYAQWGEAWVELRTQQTLAAPHRLRADLRGWLQPCLTNGGPFLDLGCGPGALLAAAAKEGWWGIGIDVSMLWLVVAQRFIAEWGGQPILAAALAEALPLADGSMPGVISLDVIEHVADPEHYLREIDRVTCSDGYIAFSTPNRYSLAAEPHIFVWGVGWLPRAWQKAYVKWRSGESYEFVRLLSTWEARGLLRQHTRFRADVLVPSIPEEEIGRFPPYRASLARLYNRLVAWGWLRPVFLAIGPFFRVVGKKNRD